METLGLFALFLNRSHMGLQMNLQKEVYRTKINKGKHQETRDQLNWCNLCLAQYLVPYNVGSQ